MIVLDPEIEAKYEVLAKMGEGGMGSVYKVRHRVFGDTRVIKTTKSEDKASADRFIKEAIRGFYLRHESIAKVIDFDVTAMGTAYIVMEMIEGQNLRQLIANSESALDPCRVVAIALQTLRALQYLHERGMVHRDISPDNLMVTQNEHGQPLIKLIDLGIAKSMKASDSFTHTGKFIGKFVYASPEQFGGSVDPRSDLYSLGIVMYELLTGVVPIGSTDPRVVMAAHLSGNLRTFDDVDPQQRVPQNLRAVVTRAFETDPAKRFQTASEFAEALRPLCPPQRVDKTLNVDIWLSDQEAISTREEQIAWETAMASDSPQAWDDFLNRYPSSARSDSARSRWEEIDQIDQKDWKEAVDESTVGAWKTYLEKHPESPRVSSARRRLTRIEEEEAERRAWDAALASDTIIALESFIRNHPDSARMQEAQAHRARVQEARARPDDLRQTGLAAKTDQDGGNETTGARISHLGKVTNSLSQRLLRARRRLKKTREEAAKALNAKPLENVPPPAKFPIQLGRFTLLEEVSPGKTGHLYKAYEPTQGVIALKVIASDVAIDRKRMLRAARAWVEISRENHENIVPIYDVVPATASHGPLIVTEYVDAPSLGQFAAETRLTLEQSLGLVVQMCRAVQHLHTHGIMHREVKPDNILVIRDGLKAKLLDSGIARRAGTTERPSRTAFRRVLAGRCSVLSPDGYASLGVGSSRNASTGS
jgi:serine/threonine protein kinase